MTVDLNEQLPPFSINRTDDPAVSREWVRQRFGHELITSKPGDYLVMSRYFELPHFKMFQVVNKTGFKLPIEKSSATHVHLFLNGSCTVTTAGRRYAIEAGQAFVCTAGRDADLDFEPYEELVLIIPPATLERVFAALTGFSPKCGIEFEPLIDTSDPRFVGFRDLALMLAGQLDPALSAWPQATLEQLELGCVSSLLYCGRHNLSHLLDRTPSDDLPRHVRIAEHFAEVNADRDICIDEMAKASAVSASTLTRAFVKYRGCTPATFVKRTRLARAKALLESRAATTVVGVALRCGFSNPSRFGKDYNDVFGETPTQTLRRLRGRPLDA